MLPQKPNGCPKGLLSKPNGCPNGLLSMPNGKPEGCSNECSLKLPYGNKYKTTSKYMSHGGKRQSSRYYWASHLTVVSVIVFAFVTYLMLGSVRLSAANSENCFEVHSFMDLQVYKLTCPFVVVLPSAGHTTNTFQPYTCMAVQRSSQASTTNTMTDWKHRSKTVLPLLKHDPSLCFLKRMSCRTLAAILELEAYKNNMSKSDYFWRYRKIDNRYCHQTIYKDCNMEDKSCYSRHRRVGRGPITKVTVNSGSSTLFDVDVL